jgi:hypothetical protein
MKPTRTTTFAAVVVALLLPTLAACSTTDAADPAPTLAAAVAATGDGGPSSETPALTTAGQVELTYAGSAQAFELDNCVSGTSSSVQGSGRNDDYAFLVDVQDGSGQVSLSNATDMTVFLDGAVSQVQVAADGSFTVDGTYTSEGRQGTFSAKGNCGMVNWS